MAANTPSILIVDDKLAIEIESEYSLLDVKKLLASLPYRFDFSSAWDKGKKCYSTDEALRAVSQYKPSGILLDVIFGDSLDRTGLAILKALTANFPSIPVVVMTSLVRSDTWADCARLGAVDYVHKPLNPHVLHQTLDRYVGTPPGKWLIGQAPSFLEAVNLAALAAKGGQTSIMITGETGTGKELLAAFIHRHGIRRSSPFEVVYLPGIPGDMQAAALFGYSKGAYTGAERSELGRFATANGGVMFLDEIGDIDRDAQLRLLRVADTGEIARLGDGQVQTVDVQIVSATNSDMARRIKDESFRYDLWARLNGMPVTLPPLNQRREDIPLLVAHLLRCEAIQRRLPMPSLPVTMDAALIECQWQGNIRGLRNFAQRAFDLANSGVPGLRELESALPLPTAPAECGFLAGGTVFPSDATRRYSHKSPLQTYIAANADSFPKQIRRLRVDEISVLYAALQFSRDPATGEMNRAKAAALLKRKRKCSTNEFDRWLLRLWIDLDEDSQAEVSLRFPELVPTMQRHLT